jgi:hypothetical protein
MTFFFTFKKTLVFFNGNLKKTGDFDINRRTLRKRLASWINLEIERWGEPAGKGPKLRFLIIRFLKYDF